MTTGAYAFRLGPAQCYSLSDGTYDYKLESFVKNAPREEVAATSCPGRRW